MWLLQRTISPNSSVVYAGENVWAREPNSSNARRASCIELAVTEFIYSRKIGKLFHKANALKARIISTPASLATRLMSERLRRSSVSSIT